MSYGFFNRAKVVLNQANLDLKRAKSLHAKKAIAQAQYEKAQYAYDIAKSNLAIARKNLANTQLKAEFNGTLAKKFVDDFARIVAKQQIALLQDNSKYKIKFHVPERDILKAKIKLNIKELMKKYNIFISFDTQYDKKYPARLYDFSTIAEPIARTYEATAIFAKPQDIVILPGMTAKVFIVDKVAKNHNFFIPVNSIFTNHLNESFVWLVEKDKRVKKHKIKVGHIKNDEIEVLSGLSIEDTIVSSGVHLLEDGQKIQIYKKMSL